MHTKRLRSMSTGYKLLCEAAQSNYHARNLVAGAKAADFVSAFESKWENNMRQYASRAP